MNGLLYLLNVIAALQKAIRVARAEQIRLNEKEQREQELHKAKLRQIEERTKSEQNKVVLSDTKIEYEQLKLLELKRKLGVDQPEFEPENYTSDPTPTP